MTYECVACAHRYRSKIRPYYCDSCGRPETYSVIDDDDKIITAVRASDIKINRPNRYCTGDSELDSLLMGGLVKPSSITAFGRGGTGKSRSCIRWGTNLGNTLLISLEMPLELAIFSAEDARADLSNLYVIESENGWTREAHRIKANVVILDSFHYSRKQRVITGTKVPLICHELTEWAKNNQGIVFAICHSNKRNEVSGTTAIEHWPDYLIKFAKHGDSEAKLTIPKSRYSPTGSCVVRI